MFQPEVTNETERRVLMESEVNELRNDPYVKQLESEGRWSVWRAFVIPIVSKWKMTRKKKGE